MVGLHRRTGRQSRAGQWQLPKRKPRGLVCAWRIFARFARIRYRPPFFMTLCINLKIIWQPYPEELRQLGFSHALKSDIAQHRSSLFRLWRMPQYALQGANVVRNEDVAALGGLS